MKMLNEYSFLVVDDHLMMRQIVGQILTHRLAGTVHYATNGEEAWQRIISRLECNLTYDVIFLDWNMPLLDGFEVLSRCRARSEMNSTAIIMLTAESEERKVIRALKAGATAYVTKPVATSTIDEKLEHICKWLEQRKAAPAHSKETST